MTKSKVAVVKTSPDTVISDIPKLYALEDDKKVLSGNTTTILKTNISWHYNIPSSNTTPWQLEGVIKRLKTIG